jgi:hypothetical protein
MIDIAWYFDNSASKLGRIWSALRNDRGIGRPPWTPGDVITQKSFDLYDAEFAHPRRQYLFLPPNHSGPDS